MLWILPNHDTNLMSGILNVKKFFVEKKRCLSLFSYFTNDYGALYYIKFKINRNSGINRCFSILFSCFLFLLAY